MVRRTIAGVVALGGALVGCFIVTGSTDGYTLVDAGHRQEVFGCTSAADCDGGAVCCASFEGMSSGSTTCQAGPCPIAQLCKTNAECGDSAPGCAMQACQVDGSSVTIQACGALPPCAIQ